MCRVQIEDREIFDVCAGAKPASNVILHWFEIVSPRGAAGAVQRERSPGGARLRAYYPAVGVAIDPMMASDGAALVYLRPTTRLLPSSSGAIFDVVKMI